MSSTGDKIWLKSIDYLRNKKVTMAYVQIGGTAFVVGFIASFILLFNILYDFSGLLAVIIGYCLFPLSILYFGISEIISHGSWWLFLSGYVGVIGGSILCFMWLFGDKS